MKVLVCGGAGFIGSAFIRNYLKNNPNDSITNIDNLTIGSNLKNLDDIKDYPNYTFEKEDIRNQEKILKLMGNGLVKYYLIKITNYYTFRKDLHTVIVY